jgi:hypothetical protein
LVILLDQLARSPGSKEVRVSSPQALRGAMGEPAVTVIHVPIVGGNP